MSELKRSLEPDDDEQQVKKAKKLKNRKFALMLCYDGHNYYGLQRNEPFKTIEGEFLKSLHKLSIIDQERFERPNIMRFQRAARTDKGVSAVRQIVSCMFPEDFPDKIEKINANLPDEIRLMAARRVVPSFDSRNFVDSRTYSYTFPTFTISPPTTMPSTYYRVDLKLIEKVNELLSKYKGTHNYHNFTSGKQPTDNSAMRYIIDINCSPPFIYDDMEFAKITIKGQSFMLHQIRKMVGMVFAIMRGHGEESKIEESFLESKQDIPIAPGLGLLLENVHYDTYNRKFSGNGVHEPIIWDEFNVEIEEFKQKFIFTNIYHQEKKNYSMVNWLETLKLHKNLFLKNSISKVENAHEIHAENEKTNEPQLFVIHETGQAPGVDINRDILETNESAGPEEFNDSTTCSNSNLNDRNRLNAGAVSKNAPAIDYFSAKEKTDGKSNAADELENKSEFVSKDPAVTEELKTKEMNKVKVANEIKLTNSA